MKARTMISSEEARHRLRISRQRFWKLVRAGVFRERSGMIEASNLAAAYSSAMAIECEVRDRIATIQEEKARRLAAIGSSMFTPNGEERT